MISRYISWDGPTPPPGESIRRIIAFMDLSFVKAIICFNSSVESSMVPIIGITTDLVGKGYP